MIFPSKILNDYPTLSWMFIDCYCERDEPKGELTDPLASPSPRARTHSPVLRPAGNTRWLKKGNSQLIKMDARHNRRKFRSETSDNMDS